MIRKLSTWSQWTSLVLGVLCVASIECSSSLRRSGRLLSDDKKCDSTSFEPIKPSVLKSTLRDVIWEGLDDQHVFALTKPFTNIHEDGVWRSTDGGSNFEDISSHFSDKGGESVVYKLMAQKSKPSNMLFISTGPVIWASSDFGTTVKSIATPGGWVAAQATYRVHPWHDDWILALVRRKECIGGGPTACAFDLFLTQDAFSGLTWKNLTLATKGGIAGFVDYDWGANLCPDNGCDASFRNSIDERRIFATMYLHPGDLDQDWDPDVIFTMSDDFFASHKTNIKCGNQFEILGHSIYLALANSCPTGIDGKPRKDATGFPNGISLYTSVDGGLTFAQACLPAAVKQSSYELTETHDKRGAVAIVDYVAKTTEYFQITTSSVYVAGPHHAIFSLSLTNVFKDPFGVTADFSKIEGIEGVYIANEMVSRYGEELDLTDRTDNYVVTKITFNGGGGWRQILAPSTFNNANCNACAGQPLCYLHLYGLSTWVMGSAARPAVYSHPSAPGVVLGVGNVAVKGAGLGSGSGGVCTWISRDGGVTWADIAEGAYIYEFADWGGIIVMAQHEFTGVTDKILFSTDYGACWHTVPLTTALFVTNIRVEPDGQRPRVLVHGSACSKDLNPKCTHEAHTAGPVVEGLIYAVDVAELLGAKLQACKPSLDFEEWAIPTEQHSPACVLGAQRYYTRRKAASTCLQGASYQRPPPRNQTCGCTYEDAECDYGYVRMVDDHTCSNLPKGKVQSCPLIDQGHYTVSDTGLRLVHNDVCTGVENIIRDTDGRGQAKAGHHHKPSHHGGSSAGHAGSPAFHFFVFVLVTVAIGGIFTAWWKFLASEPVKSQILDFVAPVGTFLESVWGWLTDKVTGRYSSIAAADNELNYFQPLGDASTEADGGDRSRFTL